MCSAPRATAPAQFKGTVLVLLVFCNLMIAPDQEYVKLCVYVTVLVPRTGSLRKFSHRK